MTVWYILSKGTTFLEEMGKKGDGDIKVELLEFIWRFDADFGLHGLIL